MWTFILTLLLVLIPVSVVLWILFSVLIDCDAGLALVIIGAVCGLVIGSIMPGFLQSDLSQETTSDVGHNALLVISSPLMALQEITEDIGDYNAGHQSLWRTICAVSYFIVPSLIGAAMGGWGGFLLAEEKPDGWPVLACIAGSILAIAVCGFLSMLLVWIIDMVTRKEFWEGVLTLLTGICVVSALCAGGVTIIIGVANS